MFLLWWIYTTWRIQCLPGGSVGKESTWNAGDCLQCRDPGSILGLGRSPGEGRGNSTSLPGKSHGERSLVGCSPWGHKESDMPEHACTASCSTLMLYCKHALSKIIYAPFRSFYFLFLPTERKMITFSFLCTVSDRDTRTKNVKSALRRKTYSGKELHYKVSDTLQVNAPQSFTFRRTCEQDRKFERRQGNCPWKNTKMWGMWQSL